MVSETRMNMEYKAFGEIIVDYVKMNILKWHLGLDRAIHLIDLTTKLSKYLTYDETIYYINYLDAVFWPQVNVSILEDIGYDNVVEVTIDSESSLVINVTKPVAVHLKTPLQLAIDNVCIEVEEKLYSGEYIDPKLKEIYDARKLTYT